jgi:hypothetical protein
MAKSTVHMFYHPGTEDREVDVRAYATVENLQKGLEKLGIADHRHMTVRTMDGKFTAIFPAQNLRDYDIGYMGFYSQHGFMTLG